MQLEANEANKVIAFQAHQMMNLTMLNHQKDQAIQNLAQKLDELEAKVNAAEKRATTATTQELTP